MENKKKNTLPKNDAAHNHKKNRPHKRKGYFIEPTPQADGNVTQIPSASPQKGDSSAKKRNDPPRQNKNADRRDRNNNDIHKKNTEAAAVPNELTSNHSHSDQTSAQQKRQPNKNKRRNNHGNRQKNSPASENAKKDQNRQNAKQENSAYQSAYQEEAEKNPEKNTVTDPNSKNENYRSNKHRRSSDRLILEKQASPAVTEADESEYEEVRFPTVEENTEAKPTVAESKQEEEENEGIPEPTVEVVGIRFKNSGKIYFFAPDGNILKRGEYAIVETARGQEYGEVAMGNSMVKESDIVPPLRPIVRIATAADKAHHNENKKKEEDAFRVCNEKIIAHGLDMKLIDAQYTFDNSKLLFYFTSAGRVDFRDLVKDLASVFRTRIELRQIGIRDEAKLMGGMGMCGRPLCCTLFLSDFGQVSIKMAKEQNLSLNSAKISGICGRLMCCLRYEHETYEYEIKRTPPVDSMVRTADGNGIVTEMNPLAGTIKVRLTASPDVPPKTYKREDVVMLQKKKNPS